MVEWLNSVSTDWWNTIVVMSIQGTVFTLMVLGFLYMMKGRQASLLQFLGSIALFKLLIPPMFFGDWSPASIQEPAFKVVRFAFGDAEQELSGIVEASMRPESIALVLWAGVTLAILVNIVIRLINLAVMVRQASVVPNAILPNIEIPSNVSIIESKGDFSPFVTGFRRHQVVLPRGWRDWPREYLRLVLIHEIVHVKRRDSWMQLAQALVFSVHFFNPIVWLLNRKLTHLRELACDDLTIVDGKTKASIYAKALLFIANSVQKCNFPAHAALGGTSLKERFQYILSDDNKRSGRQLVIRALIVILLVLSAPLSWDVLGQANIQLVDRALPIPVGGYELLTRDLVCPCVMVKDHSLCGNGKLLVASHIPYKHRVRAMCFSVTVSADGKVKGTLMPNPTHAAMDWAPGIILDAIQNTSWESAVLDGHRQTTSFEIGFTAGNY